MAKLTTNDTDLSYIAETVPGTTPTTPAFKLLPYTGGAPEFNFTTVVSEAIRSDRQTEDVIITNAEVTGTINFELSYDAFKPFLIEVLRSGDSGPYENGTEDPTTYTFLKRVIDGATTYHFYYTGCVIKSITLSFADSSLITGSMTIVGRSENATTTMITGSTYVQPAAYTVMNTASNVDTITLGGSAFCTSTMDITFENNSERATCIGTLGASDINDFTFDVTGSLEIYFEDLTQYTTFKNSTSFALALSLIDNDTNQIDISFPRCKYESMTVPVSGRNQYIMLPATYRALYSSSDGHTAELTFTDA